MDIDERIKKIMEKIEKLPEKNSEFACGAFPPEWDRPPQEEQVAKFEQKNGVKLPESYKSKNFEKCFNSRKIFLAITTIIC